MQGKCAFFFLLSVANFWGNASERVEEERKELN